VRFWTLGRVFTMGSMPLRQGIIIQGLLVALGASNFQIGLLGACGAIAVAGYLAGGWLSDRVPDGSKLLVWMALVSAGPLMLLFGALEWHGPAVTLGAMVVPLVLFTLWAETQQSMVLVILTNFLSQIVPARQRGRIIGAAAAIGGMAGLAVAAFGTWVLATLVFPHNYAFVFGLAAAMTATGRFMTSRASPLKAPDVHKPAAPGWQVWAAVWRDRLYRRFLLVTCFRPLIMAITHFIVPVAMRLYDLPAVYIGFFAMAGIAAAAVGSPVAGWIADRFGRGQATLVGSVIGAAGMAIVILVPTGPAAVAGVAVISAGRRCWMLGVTLTGLEISPSRSRGTYISTRYSLGHALLVALLPLVGYLMDVWVPMWLFALGAGVMLASGILFWRCRFAEQADPVRYRHTSTGSGRPSS